MKTHYKLDCAHDYEFVVLAINSHIKAYKLCWNINNQLGFNFEMTDAHTVSEDLELTRYAMRNEKNAKFDILSNRSKKGFLIPSQKSVNYFLVIKDENWNEIKESFLSRLRSVNEILLVFELDLEKIKNSNRFIIHD